MTIERRIFTPGVIEIRKADDKPIGIVGHAAMFNALSEDFGGWREQIAPGAFARSIAEGADVRALWNHNPEHILGRTKSGTLRLEEDDSGLAIHIDPPDTQVGRDLMVSIGRGDVSQMSFGFRTVRDDWNFDGPVAIRTLQDVDLFDVSPVTFPAYPQTDAALREFRARCEERRAIPIGLLILEQELIANL